MGIDQGKSGIHFLVFGEKRKENEAILNTNRKCSFAPPKFEKVLFYNRNSTRKSRHTFFVFGEKERKTKAF